MNFVKHFFYIFLMFGTFFLTSCASQRYHRASVEALPGFPTTAGSGVFSWPLNGRLIVPFGGKEGGVSSKGIVVEGSEGQSVCASRDGQVVYVDETLRGYGRTLILEHSGGFSTVYARNAEILVASGQWVRQGQAIARVGRAGKDGVSRAYFELRRSARPEDPLRYLK